MKKLFLPQSLNCGAILLFLVTIVLILHLSCKKEANIQRITTLNVTPHITMGSANYPTDTSIKSVPYMTVKEDGSSKTSFLPIGSIEGFSFEEGYTYVIQVSIKQISNPPADGSNLKYKLINQVSKEKE